MVGAPSSFLFLVAMPAAPSSVLAPSSDALCSARRFRPRLENRRLPATKFGSVRGCRDSSMLPRHSLKIPASACSCKSNRSTISIWSMTDSESFTWKWKTTTCLVGGISWRSAGNGGAEPHHWKEAFISECLDVYLFSLTPASIEATWKMLNNTLAGISFVFERKWSGPACFTGETLAFRAFGWSQHFVEESSISIYFNGR